MILASNLLYTTVNRGQSMLLRNKEVNEEFDFMKSTSEDTEEGNANQGGVDNEKAKMPEEEEGVTNDQDQVEEKEIEEDEKSQESDALN